MSRPTAVRRSLAAALAVVLAAGAAGCSTAPPDRDELVEALRDSGLTSEVASCTADALTRSLSTDELAQIAERGPGGAPRDDPDRTDDPADQLRTAMDACRAALPTTTLAPVTSTTVTGGVVTEDTTPDDTTPDDAGTTIAPDVDGTGPASSAGDGSSTTNPASFDTVPATTTP